MSAATGKIMSAAQQRRSSIIESGATAVARSAMIVTSSHHTRDGHSHHVTGDLQNTYQLKPHRVPKSCHLQKIVQDVLTEHLNDRVYDESIGSLTKTLAEQMKQRAKALGVQRYKYVAVVVLGPVTRTSASMASRCVWNPAFDTFGEFTLKNDSITATGVIYGLYVE
ncbi:Tctex1 domain-containing protein 1 [Elysia marginata]|uniref:Tctex1 domain-containing protein 1 n=1 Tax=Elysia marginata TaxID=1093978 RepID=A0AAV4HJZ7_9GAST|nr:Tctex1 domain-containing protein 1 [Elysia marginata]